MSHFKKIKINHFGIMHFHSYSISFYMAILHQILLIEDAGETAMVKS